MKSEGNGQKKLYLKSIEICAIIKACSDNGVTELKFGDLQVSFVKKVTQAAGPTASIPDTEISDQIEKSSVERMVKEEHQLRDDELEHMLVENPQQYEALMLRGDLESKDSGKVDGPELEPTT